MTHPLQVLGSWRNYHGGEVLLRHRQNVPSTATFTFSTDPAIIKNYHDMHAFDAPTLCGLQKHRNWSLRYAARTINREKDTDANILIVLLACLESRVYSRDVREMLLRIQEKTIWLLSRKKEDDPNAFGFSYYKVFDPRVPTCSVLRDDQCMYKEDYTVLDIKKDRQTYMRKMYEHWQGKFIQWDLGNFSREYSMSIYWSALTITTCGQQNCLFLNFPLTHAARGNPADSTKVVFSDEPKFNRFGLYQRNMPVVVLKRQKPSNIKELEAIIKNA
uniref:Decapping nuclease n=1 Tax=Heterorhabditis bacteriophora TaxID=37862 RepID=A0A1I7WUZ2_HETBA